MRRVSLYTGGGVILLAALIALVVCIGVQYKSPPVIPPVREITKIDVRLVGHSPLNTESTIDFVVPTSHHNSVLYWLSSPSLASHRPTSGDHIADLTIQTLSGTTSFKMYWQGDNPLLFTTDDRSFYWGQPHRPDGVSVDGGAAFVNELRNARNSLVLP